MVVLLPKGATDPNTGRTLKRDTWVGVAAADVSSVKEHVIDIAYINNDLTSYSQLFYEFKSITSFDILDDQDTSRVTRMYYMFGGCTSLVNLGLPNLDTSSVTDMGGMFDICYKLETLDVSNFDTSNVTSMWRMFQHCSSLKSLDLSNFNTSKVTNMNSMFAHTRIPSVDLSNFDTSNVRDMSYMFNDAIVPDLSNFDTSNVETMSYMFNSTGGPLNLLNFNTAKVRGMNSMFDWGNRESLDLSSFDTGCVTGMTNMFRDRGPLRYITISANFFKTTCAIPFSGAPYLGLDSNYEDNGWLGHIADVAPTIADSQARTIQLHDNLKNKPWAQTYIAILQDKGYTIS